jgi:hypothetical protein
MIKRYRWIALLFTLQVGLAAYAIHYKILIVASWALVIATFIFFVITLLDLMVRRSANPAGFDSQYVSFVHVLFIYCFMIQLLMTVIGKNIRLWDNFFVLIYGIFCVLLGNLCPRIPYKSLMGLWLPWVFRSEKVWRKVNWLCGILSMAFGILFIVLSATSFRLEKLSSLVWFYIVVPWATVVIVSGVYAYILYKKEVKAYANK